MKIKTQMINLNRSISRTRKDINEKDLVLENVKGRKEREGKKDRVPT
jgi:hypothetical protein